MPTVPQEVGRGLLNDSPNSTKNPTLEPEHLHKSKTVRLLACGDVTEVNKKKKKDTMN